MRRLTTRNNTRGAVAPLVAIMLIVILVCVALVVDLGHIHNVKVQMQRAVDAAALAGAQQLPDEDLADTAALEVARTNLVDNQAIGDEVEAGRFTVEVVLGIWDEETLTDPASVRFDEASAEPPNAVKVTATRSVDHIFFWFLADTEVITDAIAVYVFEEETIPIALVSCVPTGGGSLNVASPGLSVCDITTYEFHADKDDTAAWTSLTFSPASTPLIKQFLTEEGRALFNEVVYGTDSDPPHLGIENTAVETGTRNIPVPDETVYESVPRGCTDNNGTSIACGLGADISEGTETLEDIQTVDLSKLVPAGAPTDPLAYNPLPRWYHFDPEDTTSIDPSEGAFTRVWTQDGYLLGSEAELSALNNTPDGITDSPFGEVGSPDYRFKKFIKTSGGVRPDYNEVLRYAGYPPVWVNNGTIPPALDEFLARIVNADGSNTFQQDKSFNNEPFDDEGESGGLGYTVKLTIPVIFAGSCEEWKAISSGPVKTDNKLFYIGTADFLVTRAWLHNDCYQQQTEDPPAGPVIVSTFPGDCSAEDFDPTLAAGSVFGCTGGKAPNAALEGLIRPPTRGDDAEFGVAKIYLVE